MAVSSAQELRVGGERSTPAALFALVLMGLALMGLLASGRLPTPTTSETPADQFSAGRAQVLLTRMLADQKPHPLGSDANERVRNRIVSELNALGIPAEVRSRFVCAPYGVCGMPYNIHARIPGKRSDQLVVLASHYDSVFAGPGAGDAAASVAAILEIGRALKNGPPLEHDVLLLIDDGEEAGLLGARAFMQEPEAKLVRAFINMEARGTGGLSRLFETSDGNATFAGLMAKHLPHPSTSSLYFEIYKLLPNDTDLSVFRAEGGQGIGMAFIGGAQRYHTPMDDLAHLSLGSVQDQGDSALALARAFVAFDGPLLADGDAVYFDVFGQFMLFWPSVFSWPLILLAAALVGVWRWRLDSTRPIFSATLSAATWQMGAVVVIALAAWLVHTVFNATGWMPARWQANLEWTSWQFALLGAFGLALIGQIRHVREMPTITLLSGLLLILLAGSVLLQELLPGAVYMLLLPLLLGAALLAAWPRGERWAAGLLAACLLVTFGPLMMSLYESLGSGLMFVVSPLAALVLLPWLSADTYRHWAGPKTLTALVALVLVKLTIDLNRPPFDAHTPMPVSINVVQGPDRPLLTYESSLAHDSHHLLGAQARPTSLGQPFPWSERRVPTRLPDDGTPSVGPVPVLSVIERREQDRQVIWRLSLQSRREAAMVGFVHPASLPRSAVRINGVAISPGAKYNRDAQQKFLVWAVYANEAQIELTLPLGTSPEGFVFDRSAGLPAWAATDAQHRTDALGVPIAAGDATWVWAPIDAAQLTEPASVTPTVPGN
ncbi:MAG: M28 family peptidase [Ahniella sp.]|nr:M28 family peptidase [Ahniella sp.]